MILIVDDDPDIRMLLREGLNEKLFDTLEAKNGAEALKIVHEKKRLIQAVICDYNMPVMGGLSLLVKIRMIRPKMPVIIISAHPKALPTEVMNDRFLKIFEKPFDIEETIEAMAR